MNAHKWSLLAALSTTHECHVLDGGPIGQDVEHSAALAPAVQPFPASVHAAAAALVHAQQAASQLALPGLDSPSVQSGPHDQGKSHAGDPTQNGPAPSQEACGAGAETHALASMLGSLLLQGNAEGSHKYHISSKIDRTSPQKGRPSNCLPWSAAS